MYTHLVNKLLCPDCFKGSLIVTIDEADLDNDVEKGVVICPNCKNRYPITDYILEFLPRSLAYGGPERRVAKKKQKRFITNNTAEAL